MTKRTAITGLGIDIVDIDRFKSFKTHSMNSFLNKIFTKREMRYCLSFKDPAPHLAGLFAAKEAVVKVCGERRNTIFNVEIRHKSAGQPEIWRGGKADKNILISISHAKKSACAVALSI